MCYLSDKGFLELAVTGLRAGVKDRVQEIQALPQDQALQQDLRLGDCVQVNLNSGELTVTGSSDDLLANMLTALSCLVVYMLCEPRPDDGPAGIEDIGPDDSKDSKEGKPEFKRTSQMQGCHMLKLLGLGNEVPSNNWFYWVYHHKVPEVYCPWEPMRARSILRERQRRVKELQEEGKLSNQTLWLMLVSVIVLLAAVLAMLFMVYYDYELPW